MKAECSSLHHNILCSFCQVLVLWRLLSIHYIHSPPPPTLTFHYKFSLFLPGHPFFNVIFNFFPGRNFDCSSNDLWSPDRLYLILSKCVRWVQCSQIEKLVISSIGPHTRLKGTRLTETKFLNLFEAFISKSLDVIIFNHLFIISSKYPSLEGDIYCQFFVRFHCSQRFFPNKEADHWTGSILFDT